MDEDEAALLAELRAISSKNSAADRFAGANDGDDADDGGGDTNTNADDQPRTNEGANNGGQDDDDATAAANAASLPARQKKERTITPPWKKKKDRSKPNTSSSSSSSEPKSSEEGGKSSEKDQDALPPPWKRKIRVKSTTDGFGNSQEQQQQQQQEEEEEGPSVEIKLANTLSMDAGSSAVNSPSSLAASTGAAAAAFSPSSVGTANTDAFLDAVESHDDDMEDDVALVDQPSSEEEAKEAQANEAVQEQEQQEQQQQQQQQQQEGGFQTTQSTFEGERGGEAHDEELLALLRGVSSKSTKSRFRDDESGDDDGCGGNDDKVGGAGGGGGDDGTDAPAADAEKSAAAAPEDKEEVRGGDARDAELLAELKAVSSSSKSQNADMNGKVNNNEANAEDDDNDDSFDEDAFLPNSADGDDEVRGGDAHDEGLLAELKAVKLSGKWHNEDKDKEATVTKGGPKDDKEVRSGEAHDEELLAELKAVKLSTKWHNDDAEISTSAPAAASPVKEEQKKEEGGFKSTSDTFAGERGGSAEDAELLALLRGVSSKSSSNDRFAGGEGDANNGDDDAQQQQQPASNDDIKPREVASSNDDIKPREVASSNDDIKPKEVASTSNDDSVAKDDESSLPPWKRGKAAKGKTTKNRSGVGGGGGTPPWKRKKKKGEPAGKNNGGDAFEVEVAVAGGPPPPAAAVDESAEATPSPPLPAQQPSNKVSDEDEGGFKTSSTYTGERGGAAEDAELLALLRGVSSKSSSADRFADGSDMETQPEPSSVADDGAEASKDESSLPPWKRGKAARGKTSKSKSGGDVPPWKKKNGAAAASKKSNGEEVEVEIAVAGGPSKAEETEVVTEATVLPSLPEQQPLTKVSDEDEGGFKTSSTFTGERGGAAEDAELLALLRGVSSKSSSADRFANGDDDESQLAANAPAPVSEKSSDAVKDDDSSLPPWKRGKSKKSKSSSKSPSGGVPPWKNKGGSATAKAKESDDSLEVEAAVAAGPRSAPEDATNTPLPPLQPSKAVNDEDADGFKTSSTFTGDRGGAAEDAELLALLRGVSSKSSSSDRFAGDDAGNAGDPEAAAALTPPSPSASKPLPAQPSPGPAPVVAAAPASASLPTPQPSADAEPDEPLVSRDTLEDGLKDKDWKVRKASYDLLASILQDTAAGREPCSDIDANSVLPSLDNAVPAMVKDSNAAALDAALKFAVLYADYCKGAASASQASSITTALYKGSGLSSSRPTTVKLSQALPLKLMEVGEDGTSSVHSVVEVLLHQGLASRKPKVVVNSVNLVLDAAKSFGAGSLPVATVASSAPKMLGHSNAKVRDTGMNIIAEICRALGSKEPLQSVMDTLKSAQMSQLDKLLEKQPGPTPPQVGLRNAKNQAGSAGSPEDVLAALEAGAKEEAAKKLASRPAVNIFDLLPKTEYSSKLKQAKWSEKTGALDILIQCGGEQPYKLVQPSSTVSYTELIRDLRKLLEHTHFAVNSKAMAALSMLAEGVGEKLFPNIRPMLLQLTGLSKDKKLTNAVGKCLDSLFGNVLSFDHLLDKADALPTALDERKQKNALARKSTLEFLGRCIERGEAAGPRGGLSAQAAEKVAKLACNKLKDSDAQPRKAAMDILQSLQAIDDDEIANVTNDIIDEIKTDNPRAYKTLTAGGKSMTSLSRSPGAEPKKGATEKAKSSDTSRPRPGTASSSRGLGKASKSSPAKGSLVKPAKLSVSAPEPDEADDDNAPTLEDALATLSEFGLPNWDAAEDDGGILAGLKSSNWKLRKAAIESLTAFAKSEDIMSGRRDVPSPAILVVVKAHTKNFKEVNFNVVKAIMELFLVLCDMHAAAKQPPETWICKDAVALGVDKIADRKYATIAPPLLTSLCIIRAPKTISALTIKVIEKVKSPLPHEALLKWHQDICVDFGAASLGNGVNTIVPWVVKECGSSNIKVRKMAMRLVGELHCQLGPVFKALILSGDLSPSVKALVESGIDSSPFDPNAASIEREKSSIVGAGGPSGASSGSAEGESSSLGIEIPKTDLVAALPEDCIDRMGSKEGKTAWKLRKQSLEEVGAALEKCSGLIATSPQNVYTSLVELVRAMKARLSDSQSNLKPLAAKHVGTLLSCCDKNAQAKLGKLVYGPLINAVMSDNKKTMREAALAALSDGSRLQALEGNGTNALALDSFIGAFVLELKDSDFKATGLPEVLKFVTARAEYLPTASSLQSSKAQAQEANFAAIAVACLTSSKSETRAEAESMLKACSENGILLASSLRDGSKKLLPAQQRAVEGIIDGLGVGAEELQGKENISSSRGPSAAKSPLRRSASRSSARGGATASGRKPSSSLSRPATRSSSTRPQADGLRSSAVSNSSPAKSSSSGHPLLSDNPGSVTKDMRSSSLARKRENWPEYPEEPSGSSSISSLKKAWSQLLPASSVEILFPKAGMQKQDDAVAGCTLLSRAISLAKDEDDTTVIDQLDLINKWLACSLCSRENTVGLQAILSLLLDLFALLKDKSYQLSDFEATVLLPILLEKASASKGRFRKMFQDLLAMIVDDGLYPPQRYGPHICIVNVERTGHAKARGLAMKECLSCVEICGLEGIGKKGIQVTAKAYSEESLAENKTIALELVVAIIEKMNGDLQKYARVCGNSNLSDKAREMIEERWNKREKSGGAAPNAPLDARRSRRPGTSSARSSGQSSIPAFSLGSGRKTRDRPSASSRSMQEEEDGGLPSLNLRLGASSGGSFTASSSLPTNAYDGPSPRDDPFTFQYESKLSTTVPNEKAAPSSPPKEKPVSLIDEWEKSRPAVAERSSPSASGGDEHQGSATAANLRERLNKIKSARQGQVEAEAPAVKVGEMPVEGRGLSVEPNLAVEPKNDYDILINRIDHLLTQALPLSDTDAAIVAVLESLKNIHGNGPSKLGASLGDRFPDFLKKLTSTLGFACICGHKDHNAGMNIDLISLLLSNVMAILRDAELAKQVSEDALMELIKQTATLLLDPRIATTVDVQSGAGIDKGTRAQIARAVNKTVIQAVISAPTTESVIAVMKLQEQFCRDIPSNDDGTDTNTRLSKIVTKLMARTVKSENSKAIPFDSAKFDVEAFLCGVEDLLQGASKMESKSAGLCQDMAKTIVNAVIKSRSTSGDGVSSIRQALDDIFGLGEVSLVEKLVSSCEEELGLAPATNATGGVRSMVPPSTPSTPAITRQLFESGDGGTTSNHSAQEDSTATLARLITDVVAASDKTESIDKLKAFVKSNPDVDIDSQIVPLSETFRAYILKSLGRDGQPAGAGGSVISSGSGESSSSPSSQAVQNRLQIIKAKLKDADAAHAAVRPAMTSPLSSSATSSTSATTSTMRARMAAIRASSATASTEGATRDTDSTNASSNNAAALRARLEKLRRNKMEAGD